MERAPGKHLRWSAWFLMLAMLPMISGCGGCRPSPVANKSAADLLKEKEERDKKRREAEKPPIELGPMLILPADGAEPQFYLKPGHFVATQQSVLANVEDVQADFSTSTVDSDGELYDMEHVRYQIQFERPAALPKGQAKVVEANYLVPRGRDSKNSGSIDRAWLQRTFRARSGGNAEAIDKQPVLSMPDQQYHLIVLAEVPDAYAFVRNLHSIKPPTDSMTDEPSVLFYRVQILTDLQNGIPLPSQSFAWTTIAYVVWDNLQPNALSADQQQALLDWLHWGGQLIISGPGSLEKLTGSFLEPFLPAARAAGQELVQADFAELNAYWSLTEVKTTRRRDLVVKRSSLNGVRLERGPSGSFVPGTSTLVCEGPVGRGRITITAFPLTDRDVMNWGSFESFFHNALLRRPPREYHTTAFDEVTVSLVGRASLTNDARLGSGIRYFSRDLAAESNSNEANANPANANQANANPANANPANANQANANQANANQANANPANANPANANQANANQANANQASSAQAGSGPSSVAMAGRDGWLLDISGYAAPTQSGIGGWNDFSAVSNAARATLREAAGISIPDAAFVLRVVIAYLVVLVPVNWAFFRLIGRVEWAWIVAPLLAIGASLVVVRLAQLDIGFARSQTEVATLEIHAGYPRAHLTRYTALYTSLSTGYELEFDHPSAVALPFSTETDFIPRAYDVLPLVTVRRDRLVRMSGFAVDSNSTGVVHSEQMHDLRGTIDVTPMADGAWEIRNGTDLEIRDAFVMGRAESGQWTGARVGALESQTQTIARPTPLASERDRTALWRESAVLSGRVASGERGEQGEVMLDLMRGVSTDDGSLAPGDLRLVGWTDQDWSGLVIRPAANQSTSKTLIVAHLHRGPRLVPTPDKNLLIDVSAAKPVVDDPSPTPEDGK